MMVTSMRVEAGRDVLGRWAAPRVLSGLSDLRDSEISDAGCGLVSGPVHGSELVAGGFEADPDAFFFAQPASR